MRDPIIITGCARSGTSMVAGVISLCGAFGGDLVGATPYNKKGMFENLRIKNELVKPYLLDIDMDPLGQWPLPKTDSLLVPENWRSDVERIMEDQGYSSGPWFHKEAKACLIWPVWNFAFPSAKWVIVRRNTDDIIASCLRTRFMRAFKNEDGWMGWVLHHLACFEEMGVIGLDMIEIWPNPNDLSVFEDMILRLGLEWNESEVRDFLDPSLYHSANTTASVA